MDPVALYFDYNASTPIHPRVIDAMRPFLFAHFGNPSSVHSFGAPALDAVKAARHKVASLLGSKHDDEIIFTSGGTESINFALKGSAFAQIAGGVPAKRHIITSAVEHPAVLKTLEYLKKFGFQVSIISVDPLGIINLDELADAINDSTFLITVMHANNEVGTIQPIGKISQIAKSKDPSIIIHSDASQSVGKIPVSVDELGVDLLTVAGHKLYAPKGVGALYIRKGTRIDQLHHGASHEFGMRAGTENVLLDVALGEACSIAQAELPRTAVHCRAMRDRLLAELRKHLGEAVSVNGDPNTCLPNTLSASFRGIQAHVLLSKLKDSVAASAGSACHSGKTAISPVLAAMRVADEAAAGTVRFSTGKFTSVEEVDMAAAIIAEEIAKLKEQK